jgi:hypothetical protein
MDIQSNILQTQQSLAAGSGTAIFDMDFIIIGSCNHISPTAADPCPKLGNNKHLSTSLLY